MAKSKYPAGMSEAEGRRRYPEGMSQADRSRWAASQSKKKPKRPVKPVKPVKPKEETNILGPGFSALQGSLKPKPRKKH